MPDAAPPASSPQGAEPEGSDPAAVSGEAAQSGNAAENHGGVTDKDPKTLKREGEKALEEVRRAELPKGFDD